MNKWARDRKRIILSIVVLFVVGLIGLPAYLLFYRAPTCFDGKMNGDERGVDCGGSCQLLCRTESLPLIMKGDPRVLTLAPNTYQVVALVENSNNDAEIYQARYSLKLYQEGSALPVKVIEGETYVPRASKFAIFEGPFSLEEGVVPRRATLEWQEESIVWKKAAKEIPVLTVRGPTFSRLDTTPRLEATLRNSTLESVSNVDLIVLVSDASGNIFAASKTFVDSLRPGEESRILFTWPRPFAGEPVGNEIIIRIFPDRSFIR